jgi:predicted HTH domain antitoxin
MTQVTIECSEEILVALGSTPEQFEREAKLALAAKLFEMGRLSSGRAATLAGMDRVTFLMSLHRVGVAALNLDAAEFEHEARYARGG